MLHLESAQKKNSCLRNVPQTAVKNESTVMPDRHKRCIYRLRATGVRPQMVPIHILFFLYDCGNIGRVFSCCLFYNDRHNIRYGQQDLHLYKQKRRLLTCIVGKYLISDTACHRILLIFPGLHANGCGVIKIGFPISVVPDIIFFRLPTGIEGLVILPNKV